MIVDVSSYTENCARGKPFLYLIENYPPERYDNEIEENYLP